MNEDGTMARVPDLVDYCERHDLKMITVADLIAYRRQNEKLVERIVSTKLPTPSSASSRQSATAPWWIRSTTWRWSRATWPAPTTCWSAFTRSA